jgi:hypothetical protein
MLYLDSSLCFECEDTEEQGSENQTNRQTDEGAS